LHAELAHPAQHGEVAGGPFGGFRRGSVAGRKRVQGIVSGSWSCERNKNTNGNG
jgi:hypothetical protein